VQSKGIDMDIRRTTYVLYEQCHSLYWHRHWYLLPFTSSLFN